jgi:hypothetical protein
MQGSGIGQSPASRPFLTNSRHRQPQAQRDRRHGRISPTLTVAPRGLWLPFGVLAGFSFKPHGMICWLGNACDVSLTFRQRMGIYTGSLGTSGRRYSLARGAIRLGFHDARIWSQKPASQETDFCGADGSIVLADAETKRAENSDLNEIVNQMQAWSSQFSVGIAANELPGGWSVVEGLVMKHRLRIGRNMTTASRKATPQNTWQVQKASIATQLVCSPSCHDVLVRVYANRHKLQSPTVNFSDHIVLKLQSERSAHLC